MERQEANAIVGELESLTLEETRERVYAARALREQRQRNREHMARIILNNQRVEQATQEDCWHKKGGKGLTGLNRGDDTKYAVVKHQLGHGPIIVICQRCRKIWRKPKPLAKGASQEERRVYREAIKDYNAALNFPTDNVMSGNQLFIVSGGDEEEAA
jgi:hypothetical protein